MYVYRQKGKYQYIFFRQVDVLCLGLDFGGFSWCLILGEALVGADVGQHMHAILQHWVFVPTLFARMLWVRIQGLRGFRDQHTTTTTKASASP